MVRWWGVGEARAGEEEGGIGEEEEGMGEEEEIEGKEWEKVGEEEAASRTFAASLTSQSHTGHSWGGSSP